MFLYRVYRFLTSLLLFRAVVTRLVKSRVRSGKEHPSRYVEKFAQKMEYRPQGQLIWFHCASVGELKSVIPLMNSIHAENKKINFLVTTVTLTSSVVFERSKIPNAVHQFLPLDIPKVIEKFLRHWNPSLAVFVDSEIWPNLIVQTSKRCKLVSVNSRMSDKSFGRWKFFKSLAMYLLNKFSLFLPTSSDDEFKFSYFLKDSSKVSFFGNLKQAVSYMNIDEADLEKLKEQIGKRKIFLAASTHQGEEEAIVQMHFIVSQKYKDLLTIIVPRHPERGAQISKMVSKNNLKCVLRSSKDEIKQDTSIYVADTIGELGVFYKIAQVVFVGGSLVKHGGQNILEPARLKCAIIVGPHTFNFKDVVKKFFNKKAIILVKSAEDLAAWVDRLFENENLLEIYKKNALEIVKKSNNVVKEITLKIVSLVKND